VRFSVTGVVVGGDGGGEVEAETVAIIAAKTGARGTRMSVLFLEGLIGIQ
jgi:hypothetical protein